MNVKESWRSRLRGWFPQDPKASIIRSTNADLKPGRWVPLPSISGVLLIVAALLSIYFGSIFSQSYNSSYYINYSGLPIAVLHLVAVGLELISAALLLTRKHTTVAVAGMVVVLLLGLSIPLVGMLDQPTSTDPSYFRFVNLLTPQMWLNGLFLGSPLIAFSAAGLTIAWLNQRKMQGQPGFSAKAAVAALAVFWSIIAAANLIQTAALINRYPSGWLIQSSLAVQFVWLFGGAALGAALGLAVTRLQLKNPPKAKMHSRLLGWLLAVGVAAATIFAFTGFLSIGLSADTEFVLLNGIFGGLAAVFFARLALLWRFEKRQDVSIRQNGLLTFAVAREPSLKLGGTQTSKGPILLNFKSVLLSSIVLAGFAGLIFVLSNSWIRLVLLVAAVLGCLITLASKGKFRSVAKYTVVSLMIFCLCFTAYESVTFSAVGGEPVFLPSNGTPELSMDKMGNISITKTLDSIENGQVGSLLKLEHHELGTPHLIDIRLNDQVGHFTIYYSTKNGDESVDLYSSDGRQFASRVNADYSDYRNFSDEYVRSSLSQVDALGLQWFYNQALEIAHNRTATLHSIDTVVFSLNYNTNTEGLSVGISAHYSTPGSNYYPSVIAAAFYPNGTLISMSTPRETPIA